MNSVVAAAAVDHDLNTCLKTPSADRNDNTGMHWIYIPFSHCVTDGIKSDAKDVVLSSSLKIDIM